MGIFSRKSAAAIRATLDKIDGDMLIASNALSDIEAKRRELSPLAFEGDGEAKKELAAVNDRRRAVEGELEELRFTREAAQADYDAAVAREAKATRKADYKRFRELLDKRVKQAAPKVEAAAIALRDAIREDLQGDREEIMALHKKLTGQLPPEQRQRFRPREIDPAIVAIRITQFAMSIGLTDDIDFRFIPLADLRDLRAQEAEAVKPLLYQVDRAMAYLEGGGDAPAASAEPTSGGAAIAGYGKANGSGQEVDHDTAA